MITHLEREAANKMVCQNSTPLLRISTVIINSQPQVLISLMHFMIVCTY